jgi:hypothetical protein
LDRIGLGIALIVAFSVGLAAVLAGVSAGLLWSRRMADKLARVRLPLAGAIAANLSGDAAAARVLPVAGAASLVVIGCVLTLRASIDQGLLFI